MMHRKLITAVLSALLFPAVSSKAQPITSIAGGGLHSLFIKGDGSLWAVGSNGSGQLGDGPNNDTNKPEQLVSAGVTAIAAGGYHSLFLKSDGSLWAVGDNTFGQLGDGTSNNTNRPEQIVANGVRAIAAGNYHSLFLRTDNSLWGMGANNDGQLGDGTNNNTNRPERIVVGGITAIGAGGYHSLFLKSDASLWAMGYNFYGQLGIGTYSAAPPFGTNRPAQTVAGGVTQIAGAYNHSLFLKSDGSLWAMGYNYYGQLGDSTNNDTNRPEQIVAYVGLPVSIVDIGVAGTNLILTGINGHSGATCAVLMSSNVSLPRTQWTPLVTNVLTANGNFTLTLTNAVDRSAARRFFTLRFP